MASKNNLLTYALVGAGVLGAIYVYNKSKPKTSENYPSEVTSDFIPEATQATIRTDLRQASKTDRAAGRQSVRIIKAQEKTSRAAGRQSVRVTKAQEKTSRVKIRQDSKTERLKERLNYKLQRQEQRQEKRAERKQQVKNIISNIRDKLKRKKWNT